MTLTKTIRIGGGRFDPSLTVEVEIANAGPGRLDALLGIEFAVMLLGGGHNPAAFHDVDGRRVAHDETLEAEEVARLRSGNDQVGVAIETVVDAPVDRLGRPDPDRLELRSRVRARLPGQCDSPRHGGSRLSRANEPGFGVDQCVTVGAAVPAGEVVARP